MVDTLGKSADPSLPTENVQRAQGLTVQARALAMDPDGNILVRVSSWLGNMKLGAEGTGTWNSVGTDIRYRTYGQTPDTAFHTDDGRSYVEFRLPRVWLDLLSTGDALKILAPLEPRPRGAQFPRNLTMNLEVVPNVMASGGSSILFRQEFTLTVSLPEQTAHINIDDFLPPTHRQQMRFAPGSDQSTLAGNIAGARASQYELQGNFLRAIYWHRRGLDLVEPFTNDAQLRRLAIAHTYQEALDLPRAAAMYRAVICISRDHPETWNYYAFQAKGGLDYLARHRRDRR
jgi:hypothetical protein